MNETARVEAFSDGVFAIAITLLVLNLKAPAVGDIHGQGELFSALARQWPVFLAFITSFLTILIMWINHHNLFHNIRRIDQTLLMLNGLLLLGITILPFPTALVAEHILAPAQNEAAFVYGAASLFTAIGFNGLWWYISSGNRLIDSRITPEQIRAITWRYLFGPVFYLLASLVAFLHAPLSLVICLALAVFFAVQSHVVRPILE